MSFLVAKSSIVAGVVLASFLQAPTVPPIKMGLWETSSTSKTTVPNMPAGMPGMGPRTMKVRSCMTPDSYAKGLAASQQQKDCVRSNESMSSKGFSFDLSCRGGKQTGHFEMVFDSPEASHGTMHLNMGTSGAAATTDSTFTASFVSADCGAVTPDKPVILH